MSLKPRCFLRRPGEGGCVWSVCVLELDGGGLWPSPEHGPPRRHQPPSCPGRLGSGAAAALEPELAAPLRAGGALGRGV